MIGNFLYLVICESVIEEDIITGFEKISSFASFEKDAFVDFSFRRFFQGSRFFPELIRARIGIIKERRRFQMSRILHKCREVVN